MQAYISDLIRRLPANIRVLPPALTPAVVVLDQRALRAVIDNLVKNAEQAMMNGGDIAIDYMALQGEDMVLLSSLILEGEFRRKSSKRSLLEGQSQAVSEKAAVLASTAQPLVRRAGGDLEPMQRHRGIGWLITLPLAPVPNLVGTLDE